MILIRKFTLQGLLLVCFIGALPVSCVGDEARVKKKNGEEPPIQKTADEVDSNMLKDLDLFLDFEMIEMMEIFQEQEKMPSERNPQNPEEIP